MENRYIVQRSEHAPESTRPLLRLTGASSHCERLSFADKH
jgi:hypothetical protein